jgi:phage gpG-like protein
MAKVLNILDIAKFLNESSSAVNRALTLAQIVSIKKAEVEARNVAQQNFVGRNDRRLSGALMNNIYSGFESSDKGIPSAFLGVKSIPYGAIHEYGSGGLPGGVIRPVRAQKLWIPHRANAGRMTPREFINLMKAQPNRYFITRSGAFREDGLNVYVPLFFRVDQVRIPARPYLRPGIAQAYEDFADRFEHFYKQEIDRI